MPLPAPRQGESRSDFISRCVSDENVQNDSSSNAQAVAICASLYDRERAATPNARLLASIKTRGRKREKFGYGIMTADVYVRTLLEAVGSDACYAAAATKHTSFNDILQKASNTLVYSDDKMVIEEKQTGSFKLPGAPDDLVLPKNTLMVLDHWVTTPRIDRDGDILRSEGFDLDPKMLMLWQHVHTLPIGKYLYTRSHTKDGIRVMSAIVDGFDMSHDAAVMADNGMLRFSHGFRAEEYKDRETEDNEFVGFDITKGEIMEESGVSVPSNVDAQTEEVILSFVEGGKLTSGLMKNYGKQIRQRMPVTVGIKYQERLGDYERTIETSNRADFETVFKQTGKSNEDKSTSSGAGEEGTREGIDATSEKAHEDEREDSKAATSEEVEDKQVTAQDEHNEVDVTDISKSAKPEEEKQGRTLSKANESNIREASELIVECVGMDVSRPVKAMLREASGYLKTVLESIGTDDETSVDVDAKGAMAIFLEKSNTEQKQRLLTILTVLDKQEQAKKRSEQFRAFVGA